MTIALCARCLLAEANGPWLGMSPFRRSLLLRYGQGLATAKEVCVTCFALTDAVAEGVADLSCSPEGSHHARHLSNALGDQAFIHEHIYFAQIPMEVGGERVLVDHPFLLRPQARGSARQPNAASMRARGCPECQSRFCPTRFRGQRHRAEWRCLRLPHETAHRMDQADLYALDEAWRQTGKVQRSGGRDRLLYRLYMDGIPVGGRARSHSLGPQRRIAVMVKASVKVLGVSVLPCGASTPPSPSPRPQFSEGALAKCPWIGQGM